MKGFGIYVKNDLLDGKHLKNMGPAVWLYMWYLDKITAINDNEIGKILGGQPITYEIVKAELSTMTRRTYMRWLDTLRDAGYINTLRTPSGLVVTINKAAKVFKNKGSAKSGTSNRDRGDTPKMAQPKSDVPNLVSDVPNRDIQYKTLTTNVVNTKTVQGITNVIPVFDDGTPDPRNQQVQQVVEHFEKRIGKMPQAAYQRRAAQTLIQRHGFEKTIGGINIIAMTRGEQFAPNITSLAALRDKWLDLENFCARVKNKKTGLVRI